MDINSTDQEIEFYMLEFGLSKAKAAKAILDKKSNWYTQTPEGEYLLSVIENETD